MIDARGGALLPGLHDHHLHLLSLAAASASVRDLAPAERITPRRALDGLLAPLDDPGGPPRRITVVAPADLCLLHVPLAEAMSSPDATVVAATLCAGQLAF